VLDGLVNGDRSRFHRRSRNQAKIRHCSAFTGFFCEKLDSVASIKAVDLLAIVRFLVLRHGGAIQIVS